MSKINRVWVVEQRSFPIDGEILTIVKIPVKPGDYWRDIVTNFMTVQGLDPEDEDDLNCVSIWLEEPVTIF